MYNAVIKIKEYREKKNFTQRKLAEIIDVNEAVISNWETGKNRPSIDYLRKLCSALGVTADELLGIQQTEKNISNDALKMARLYDESEEKRKRIIQEILEL